MERIVVAKDARVVSGGHREHTVVEATLLEHVTPAMRVHEEEPFDR